MATTQSREAQILDSVPNQLLIAGEWRDAGEGGTLGVEDPATGETLCEVADARPTTPSPRSTPPSAAQAEWAAHPPRERGGDPAPGLRGADRARRTTWRCS